MTPSGSANGSGRPPEIEGLLPPRSSARFASGLYDSVRRRQILGARDERSDRLFSLVGALVLLPAALPLAALVAFLVLVTSGRPILHRGLRLGRNRRPFLMLKFRTLVPDAAERLGAALVESSDRLSTPIGEFLRKTRLDELPQLFNVLAGEMSLVGPRPVRPEVYEACCRALPGFDRRFVVRPGLIGQSQLFTPHRTPKRMRQAIDNRFLARRHAWVRDLVIVVAALYYLTRGLVRRTWQVATRSLVVLVKTGRLTDQRALDRLSLDESHVAWEAGPGERRRSPLLDINEEAFLFAPPPPFEPPPRELVLETPTERRAGRRVRRARIAVRAIRDSRRECEGRPALVVHYEPVSGFHGYLVHQYFLAESIIAPQRFCR